MDATTALPEPPQTPRVVPLTRAWGYAWVGMLLGGTFSLLTLLFLGYLALTFGLDDLSGARDSALDGDNFVAAGRIVAAEPLSYHSHGNRAIRYRFEYRVGDGPPLTGTCFGWSEDGQFRVGAKIGVQYLPDEPATARIVDTRLTVVPGWAWGVLLAIFVIGDIVAASSLVRALRRRTLLENATAVRGQITELTGTRWVNPKPTVLHFEAEDPATGQPVTGSAWLRASRVPLRQGALPAPCWVAVEADLSGRSALLAFPGWTAWQPTTLQ